MHLVDTLTSLNTISKTLNITCSRFGTSSRHLFLQNVNVGEAVPIRISSRYESLKTVDSVLLLGIPRGMIKDLDVNLWECVVSRLIVKDLVRMT